MCVDDALLMRLRLEASMSGLTSGNSLKAKLNVVEHTYGDQLLTLFKSLYAIARSPKTL